MPDSLVLLHGFSGTHRAWDGVIGALDHERYSPPLALDLPGHGQAADAPRPITFAGCVEHVLALSPARFTLCGYSLGGRVALHVALAAPDRVQRLVLVSASPGIEDPAVRAARRESDRALAGELETADYEGFIERWRSQPLFAGEPPDAGGLARADQRRNRPDALAAVLRGLGAGEMPPLLGRLGELQMPVTLLVGERDEKYIALARRMARELVDVELIVLPGGHGLVFENPYGVADVLATPSPSPRGGIRPQATP
ncbi:MAG TPA: alpha/beta fold hydrolase [Solirubrobacteraceae bacterium]|nr:alpha/beta fold hydrolase [Solirubrobacteraceae bacterium]